MESRYLHHWGNLDLVSLDPGNLDLLYLDLHVYLDSHFECKLKLGFSLDN